MCMRNVTFSGMSSPTRAIRRLADAGPMGENEGVLLLFGPNTQIRPWRQPPVSRLDPNIRPVTHHILAHILRFIKLGRQGIILELRN